ncbi:JAB domain-containing protein [Neisseria gonorrhoeae]
MSIKQWPEGERPREKLLERGAAALSDAELLAILLRVGTRGMSAEVGKLSAYKGMGTASFTQFAVVREIGRRILEEELQEEITLSDPDTVADYLRFHLGQEKVEVSVALLLNRQNQLIAVRELSRGTVAENTIYIREIVKLALDEYADSLIIAHNHPGGSPEPSQEDIMFTRRLAQAMSLVDVSLLDHFIVTSQTVRSFRQLGLMP